MGTWEVTVNGTAGNFITADTYMEAELIARIQFGTTARVEIKEAGDVADSVPA